MREGWEMKKLGEVVVVERGSSPRPIKNFLTTEKRYLVVITIQFLRTINMY